MQGSDGYANNVTESSSPADNGTIAFSRLAGALHIWRIDHATDPRFTSTSKVTEDPATDISPYILHGRRWLAFSRGSETLHDIWVRDIQSGNESLFLASSIDKASPIVDDSSNAVVFEIRNNGSTLIFTNRRERSRSCYAKAAASRLVGSTEITLPDFNIFQTDGAPYGEIHFRTDQGGRCRPVPGCRHRSLQEQLAF